MGLLAVQAISGAAEVVASDEARRSYRKNELLSDFQNYLECLLNRGDVFRIDSTIFKSNA
jgi:hypothetical protein